MVAGGSPHAALLGGVRPPLDTFQHEWHYGSFTPPGVALRLFGWIRQSDPQHDLVKALAVLHGRADAIEKRFDQMRLEWEIVTAHVDQLSAKAHRELGHVTKRRADLAKLEPDDQTDVVPHRSRFSGGRRR